MVDRPMCTSPQSLTPAAVPPPAVHSTHTPAHQTRPTSEGAGKLLGGTCRWHLNSRRRQGTHSPRQRSEHATGQHSARHSTHERRSKARRSPRQPHAGGQQRQGSTQQGAQEGQRRRQRAASCTRVCLGRPAAGGASTQVVRRVRAGRHVGWVRPPRAAGLLCGQGSGRGEKFV